MTARGKRKENNEIKPLPPGLDWDGPTCLFSTEPPAFSALKTSLQLWEHDSSPQKERKKKKKRWEWRKKKQQLSIGGSFHLLLQALSPFARCKDGETKGRVLGEARRGRTAAFPLSWGQVDDRQTDRQSHRQLQAQRFPKTGMETYNSVSAPKEKEKKAKDFSNSRSGKYKFLSFILTEKQSFFSLRKKKRGGANTGFLSFSNAGLGSKSLPSQ